MSKLYYKYRIIDTDLPSNPTVSRIYTLFQKGDTIYGFDDKPYNFVFKVKSGLDGWCYANQSDILDSETRIDIGFSGNVGTQRKSLYYAVDSGSQWDNFMHSYGDPVTLGPLNGKYRIISSKISDYKDTVQTGYVAGLNFVPVITDFIIGSTLYKGFIITGTIERYTKYTGDHINLIRENGTVESYTMASFGSVYNNSIIEFANTEIPETLANWFLSFLDVVYPYTYTVKDYTGEITLSEITESPPMSKALLTVIGNQKTLTLTGINGMEYPIKWSSEPIEGKQFTGLANSPKSNKISIPINTPLDVSFADNITWYEGYGKYQPPATTFDINLYQNHAESNRVNKEQLLVSVGTLSGALREECSMLTPSITYQSSDVPTFNYVYIPIFNRYYFVTSLASVSKNMWRMELKCDVLMSYKEQILSLHGVIGRQENDFNDFLIDDKIITQKDSIVEVLNPSSSDPTPFDTRKGFDDYIYALTVIGG